MNLLVIEVPTVKRAHEIDFSEGRLLPKLFSFALPVMLSGILQLAFNAADLIVVGRFDGEVALAAVGSNGALVSLVVNVFMGLGSGVSVLAARYFGAKDDRRMGETVETAAIVGILGGILTALVGLILSVPMLRIMSTPENVLPLAAVYLRIYFLGIPFLATYNVLSAEGITPAEAEVTRYHVCVNRADLARALTCMEKKQGLLQDESD